MARVLITGGNSGIGLATVKKYLNNGYEVITTYCHNKDFNHLSNVTYYYLDLTSEESIDNLVNIIPTIDVLINNAGIASDKPILDKSFNEFITIIDTNLVGPLYLTKSILKTKLTKGSVIFVSSDNAINANYPESIDYDASKAGLIKISEDFAKSFAPNIRFNIVAPGWVETKMNQDMTEEYYKETIAKLLMHRFAKPEEIANVIYFLSSAEASYINGATIVCNGGLK